MIVTFTIIAAIIGLVPGGHFILIPMEIFLVYRISQNHNAFDFLQFIVMTGVLIAATGFLGGLASFLHVIPVIGQLANSIVAAGVMYFIGSTAENYYSKK